VAESTYRANLERAQRVAIRPNVAATVKEVGEDPDAHRDDRTVLATHAKGEFTAGRLAQYVIASPPQQQLRQQIAMMPDSMAPRVVEQFVFLDLVLAQADSANVQVDTAQQREIERAFVAAVTSAWRGLGIAPAQLADSAQTAAARDSMAAARVERYFEALVKGEAPFVQIPPPIETALKEKYSYKVNDAGVERALELATRVRAKADSARAAQQPPTAVPMPGAPQGAPQGGQPAAPPATPPVPQGQPAAPPGGD
jgi:peptidyl-prolyl cis-trans isomerase D